MNILKAALPFLLLRNNFPDNSCPQEEQDSCGCHSCETRAHVILVLHIKAHRHKRHNKAYLQRKQRETVPPRPLLKIGHGNVSYLGLLSQTCVMLKGREREKSTNYLTKHSVSQLWLIILNHTKLLLLRPTVQHFLKIIQLYVYDYLKQTFVCLNCIWMLLFGLCFIYISLTQFTGWDRRVPAQVLLALNLTDAFQRVTIVTFKGDISPRAISISLYSFLNTLNFWEYTSDLWNKK